MKKILLSITLLALMGQGCFASPSTKPVSPSPTTPSQPNIQGLIYNVDLKDMKFQPNNFTVKKGTKIVFVNRDSVAHNVTADNKEFDSGNIQPGQSYTLDTLSLSTGSHPYSCTIHPSMKGTLIIRP